MTTVMFTAFILAASAGLFSESKKVFLAVLVILLVYALIAEVIS